MGFLYPLFLLAGLAVAIPIFLHLFDLRRFRKVIFPGTRFLQEVLLRSQRQRKVRDWLLLALRCAFIIALVLAFAQPLWPGAQTSNARRIQVIVLDNNPATGARKDGRTLLENGKDVARQILRSSGRPTYLLLATGPYSYSPLTTAAAEAALTTIQPATGSQTSPATLATIQGLITEEGATGADLWWISPFSKPRFELRPERSLLKGIAFNGVVMPSGTAANTWIDTAFVLPTADPTSELRLVARSRTNLSTPPATAPLRLTANNRFQSASAAGNWQNGLRTDTLAFSGQSQTWQQLELTLADGVGPSYDDTFRIAVRPLRPLPVLVLEDGAPNPYLQTALAASGRFEITRQSLGAAINTPEKYALILLSGLRSLPASTVTAVRPAITRSVPLMVFPARTSDVEALETGLRQLVDIRISGLDTALQTATSLQSENPVITEIFESTPPNMELPAASWHYKVQAGFNAQPQAILSFRNGDPLFAEYSTGSGKLYLLTSGAEAASGSFSRSYFFAPLLHAAAVSAAGATSVAYTSGSGTSVFLPRAAESGSRNVVKLIRNGEEAIPMQRQATGGIEIFPDGALTQTGFYTVAGAGADTLLMAFNASRQESNAAVWTLEQLRGGWPGMPARWLQPDAVNADAVLSEAAPFPLWKILATLALILLFAETAVLIRARRLAGNPIPQP